MCRATISPIIIMIHTPTGIISTKSIPPLVVYDTYASSGTILPLAHVILREERPKDLSPWFQSRFFGQA